MTNPNDSGVRLSAAHDFVNLAIAELIGRGDPIQAAAFAEARGWVRPAMEIRGAVDAIGEGDYVSPIRSDYAREVMPLTLPGRLAGMGQGLFGAKLVNGTGEVVAEWVAAGAPIPVSADAFAEDPALARLKLGTLEVFSQELVRSVAPAARSIIEARIRRAVTLMTDRGFTDPTAAPVPDESPGSIAYGAPTINATGGAVADIDAAVAEMVDVLVDGGSDLATAAWLMSPKVATGWSLKRGSSGAPAYPGLTARGGTLAALPVYVSPGVGVQASPSEDIVLLVDAAGCVVAQDDLAISSSGQASVQMSSTPSAGAQPLVSLWQKNLAGLRITKTINWARRRDAAVVVLRHVVR